MAARQGVVAAMVLLAGVSVAGCRSSSSAGAESGADTAASVTEVQGRQGIHRVALTADAAERIGLQTGTVRSRAAAAKPAGALTVPLSAVLYDKDGATWVFAAAGTLAFQREKVTISGVDGELAVLSAGPAAGTAVVTVGAAELLGAEDGVPGE